MRLTSVLYWETEGKCSNEGIVRYESELKFPWSGQLRARPLLLPLGRAADFQHGQWVVKPEFMGDRQNRHKHLAVIHVDCIARGALLSPVYGSGYLPDTFHFSASLDAFHTYFINNYADHHMHKFVPKFN